MPSKDDPEEGNKVKVNDSKDSMNFGGLIAMQKQQDKSDALQQK